jgi:hypothetical protein
MTIETLEKELAVILPAGFQIATDNQGQLMVYLGLRSDDNGELVPIEDDE